MGQSHVIDREGHPFGAQSQYQTNMVTFADTRIGVEHTLQPIDILQDDEKVDFKLRNQGEDSIQNFN